MSLKNGDYRRWRDLWEQMMRQYCPGRDSAYGLALDLIPFLLKGPHLKILDLACGSGSFTEQAADRIPQARLTAVDRSCQSLHIARSVLEDRGVQWIEVDLGDKNWVESLSGVMFDAVFTGWMTHEVKPWRLPELYRELAKIIREGGILFNVDFMGGLEPGFQQMALDITRGRVTEDFRKFDRELEEDPTIRELSDRDSRGARTRWITHHHVDVHLKSIRDGGFQQADVIWRYLNSGMVMAVR